MSELTPIIPSVIALSDRILPRYFIPAGTEEDKTDFRSFLGTPVYSPLLFHDVPVNTGIIAGQVQSQKGKVLLTLENVLMTVTQSKSIVRTAIQGRPGTVKEFISSGDFQIEIEGSIISPYPGVFPEDDFRTFNKILGFNTQVDVTCEFLNLCGIFTIVIESAKMSQKIGSRNEVPFTISAWDDTPLENRDRQFDYLQ